MTLSDVVNHIRVATERDISLKASATLPPSSPYLPTRLGNLTASGLLDTGANRSLISLNVMRRVDPRLIHSVRDCDITLNLASEKQTMNVTAIVELKIKIDKFAWIQPFLVAPTLQCDLILGMDFILSSQMLIDFSKNSISFMFKPNHSISISTYNPIFVKRKYSGDHSLFCVTAQPPDSDCDETDQTSTESKFTANSPNMPDLSHLSPKRRDKVLKILDKYVDVVLTKRLGKTNLIEYEIRLTDKKPVRKSPYPLAPPMMEKTRQLIKKLEDDEVIEVSTSSYASPCFPVPKGEDKYRLVVDYRQLNQKVEFESIPVPDLKTALSWFGDAKYFVVIDLNQAYHQIGLKKTSKPYTAFCTPWNLYQYKRIPFGLSVGGCVLTRLMDLLFHDMKFKCLVNYLDDLVLFADTFDQLLVYLDEVLKRLKDAGMTINPEKLRVAVKQISYLGNLVSYRSIKIDPSRTEAIRNFQPPKNAKGIARFLGMVGYYSKFIHKFAEIAAPLNALRKKNAKFIWSSEQQEAFEQLKAAISNPPVLRTPNFALDFILQSDASPTACSGVLLQNVDGTRMPVAYYSHRLTQAESKYDQYELECLAAILSMEHFKPFLDHREFILETDNQALSWLLNHPRQQGRLARWVLRINSFKFRAGHIKGSENIIADALSRMYEGYPQPENSEQPSEKLFFVDQPHRPSLDKYPMAFTDLETHQSQDPNLQTIKEKLLAKKTVPRYSLIKNILYFQPSNKGAPKIVLPAHVIPMIFDFFHESLLGGHLGRFKTLSKIQELFYYRGMAEDVRKRVANCVICAMSKPAQRREFGHLSSDTASVPMEKWFVDFVGPFPRTTRGFTQIFVVVDGFSKFTWLIPAVSASGATVIRELGKLFQNFSMPRSVVSDNGPAFRCRQLKRWLFTLGVRPIKTNPYYPNPNHAERVNRNLKAALIAFNSRKQTQWDLSLPWLQQAFNFAIHEATKATPHSLMFTYPPTTPLALQWRLQELLPEKPTEEISETWERARKNLIASHNRYKRQYNAKHGPHGYRVGDLVFMRTYPVSSKINHKAAKLCSKFEGPYQIQRFLTPVSALLADPSTGQIVKRAHVSQLKRFSKKTKTPKPGI